MARPVKYSIDYFPVDVDIFDDEKLIPVSSEYGAQGEAIIIRILCSIYRNGYFIEYTESLIYKIAKQAAVSHEIVEGVINGLIRWHFFNQELYQNCKVLSSSAIQSRWKEAVKKRVISRDILPYWIDDVSGEETPVSASETPISAEETKSIKSEKNQELKIVSGEETPISAPETQISETETTAKRHETTQKKRKENIYKEIYKEKELSFIQNGFLEPMKTWLIYKKQRREGYKTEDSLKACYENLLEISRGSPEMAKKIVHKAMANNWAGLFPLKNHELTEFENGPANTTGLQKLNQGTRVSTL